MHFSALLTQFLAGIVRTLCRLNCDLSYALE
jgi:hypothetical protein